MYTYLLIAETEVGNIPFYSHTSDELIKGIAKAIGELYVQNLELHDLIIHAAKYFEIAPKTMLKIVCLTYYNGMLGKTTTLWPLENV